MTLRRYKQPPHKRADAPTLLPPDLRTFGTLAFTPADRGILDAWLAAGGWPRGTMSIAMLEGYLVALLVWPVGVSPGAWLPPIWGERGWKVPEKLASPGEYTRFVALVTGFLQALDRELSGRPPSFAVTLSNSESPSASLSSPCHCWAQGFLRALQLSLQGPTWRSAPARTALASIAAHASPATPATQAYVDLAEDLTSAVLTLAGERTTRGPLGALESGNDHGRGTAESSRWRPAKSSNTD